LGLSEEIGLDPREGNVYVLRLDARYQILSRASRIGIKNLEDS
jgi:hypothetical protein